jgi:hypothetical protein
MQQKTTYLEYGSQVNARQLETFLRHMLRHNQALDRSHKPQTPVCIWGKHGIGKTEIVETLAADLGYQLAYIAPAQFEEMGDLLGMPAIEGQQTVFRAPEWVPTAPGPGILLIDDVNRADDRILRGLMQLLQRQALVSWSLPEGWQIILTANPDSGDYSVTPMDEAMLTRMAHITLVFDAQAWAAWADQNGIDARAIHFVIHHPEVITGHRTTPRTLVQFFQSISAIANWPDHLSLIRQLGEACLDTITVAAFIAFIQQQDVYLPSPLELLEADDFARLMAPIARTNRVDLFYTLCTRLSNYLQRGDRLLTAQATANLRQFLLLKELPADLRFQVATTLSDTSDPQLQLLLADPEISQLIMQ